MSVIRYRDMTIDKLKELVKATENERAKHRIRHGDSATVASFDKQIEEAQAEIARRRDGEGTGPT